MTAEDKLADDTLEDFARLQEALIDTRRRIQQLLARGYPSAGARRAVEPFFDEFARGFDQVNGSLRGIGDYLSTTGGPEEPAVQDFDSRLG